ncbi:hypothetical protein B296_00003879, partial [Ensete ventricosum]
VPGGQHVISDPLFWLQTIIAQVNHAIGAEGIVSVECKEVVNEYGEIILELLIAEVCSDAFSFLVHCSNKIFMAGSFKVVSTSSYATISFVKIIGILLCSTDIQSVLEKQKDRTSANHDVLCTACEMAVIWIENQLRRNQTKERILAYANEVASLLMHSPI